METNGQTKIDVAKLEVRVGTLTDDVKSIKDNHLPHIYEKLGSIEKKQAYYAGGIAVVVIAAQWILNTIK